MSLLKYLLFAWLLLGGSTASAMTREIRLQNGLRVTLAHVPGAERVGIWLNVAVGAADEDLDLRGMAHLAEHLFVRGSSDLSTFAARASALGGEGVNAGTDFDATNFYWTVPVGSLRQALRLEADRLRDPGAAVSAAVLKKERQIVLAEVRESDWTLDTRVKRVAFPILYGKQHPHAVLPDGRPGDLQRLSASQIRAFLRRWYSPAMTRLIVAGDLDMEATAAMIGDAFSAIPASAAKEPAHATFPMTTTIRRAARLMLEADTAAVTFYGVAPGRSHNDSAPLEKAVAALRTPFADAARLRFGPSVKATLAYRPSARTGNVMVRLVFAGRSPAAGAEEFLRNWLRITEVAEVAPEARPRSPLHPAPGTVLAAAYALLVDDQTADKAFARTNSREANAAIRRWFVAPMLAVSTTARSRSTSPLARPVKVEGWTMSTFADSNPTLTRIEIRGPATECATSRSVEAVRKELLGRLREDLGWTYQVRHDFSEADPAEVVLNFLVPRRRREVAVRLSLDVLRRHDCFSRSSMVDCGQSPGS